MGTIWTNWKVALWRYRYGDSVFFLLILGLSLVSWDRVNTSVSAIISDARSVSFVDGVLCFGVVMTPLLGLLHEVRVQEREMTAKPLTFCLPGYRQSMSRTCFAAALPWGTSLALVGVALARWQGHLSRSENPEFFAVCLCLGSTFLAGVAMGLATQAARLVLSKLRWAFLVPAPFLLGILGVGVWMIVDVRATAFWVGAGLLSIVVIAFCGVGLRNMRYVARGHRRIIGDAMDKRVQGGVKGAAPSWVDDLFLGWAERYPPLKFERYVWIHLYRAFARTLSYWKWALVGAGIVSVVLALTPNSVAEIAFALLGFTAAFVDLTVTSSLLLPGGRRERYHATIVTALATSLLLLTLALGIAGLSGMIAFGLRADSAGLGFRFRAAWLACVPVPWIGAAGLRGRAGLGIENMVAAMMVGFLALAAVYLPLGWLFKWPVQTRLLFFESACLCGWVMFVLALRRVCLQGCLLGQTVWREE